MNILNSIHGGVVLSINNYLYIKNKDYIRKINDKHIFYWTCVKQCSAKKVSFYENNKHYIDKNCIFSENKYTTLQSQERLKQLILMSVKKRLDKLLNVKDVIMMFIWSHKQQI